MWERPNSSCQSTHFMRSQRMHAAAWGRHLVCLKVHPVLDIFGNLLATQRVATPVTLSMLCWRRGRPTDIYALGACLFTFVYGRIPFSAPTVYQLFQVVQTEPLRFPEEPLVSDDLKNLLTQMLIKVGVGCSSKPAGSDMRKPRSQCLPSAGSEATWWRLLPAAPHHL